MSVKFTNNVKTKVSEAVSLATDVVVVDDVSRFPVLGPGEYTYCTLTDTTRPDVTEICEVTAIDIAKKELTVVRGKEGTESQAWRVGANCELRLTAELLTRAIQEIPKNEIDGNITKIQVRRGPDSQHPPSSEDIDVGELTFNYDDGNVYSKLEDGTIVLVGSVDHISDSPADTFLYGRRDGDWDRVSETEVGELIPENPSKGALWYDTATTAELYVYDGSNWISMTGAGGGGGSSAGDNVVIDDADAMSRNVALAREINDEGDGEWRRITTSDIVSEGDRPMFRDDNGRFTKSDEGVIRNQKDANWFLNDRIVDGESKQNEIAESLTASLADQEKMKERLDAGELKQDDIASRVESGELKQNDIELRVGEGELKQDDIASRVESGELKQNDIELRVDGGELKQEQIEERIGLGEQTQNAIINQVEESLQVQADLLLKVGELEIEKGSPHRYKIKSVEFDVATRAGQMCVDNADAHLVQIISLAAMDLNNEITKPCEDGDLLEFDWADGGVARYQINSGNHDALSVTYISGTHFFEVDQELETYAFPQNVGSASTDYVDQAVDNAIETAVAQASVPLGTIVFWGGTREKIPNGWAECNGATASSSVQAMTGLTKLPDLRNYMPAGIGGVFGGTAGSQYAAKNWQHSHTWGAPQDRKGWPSGSTDENGSSSSASKAYWRGANKSTTSSYAEATSQRGTDLFSCPPVYGGVYIMRIA